MKLVVVGNPPVEITSFLAQRRALGQDTFDEVWEGEYHVVPAPHSWHGQVDSELAALLRPPAKSAGLFITSPFNLGVEHDYRVPDGGYHRARPSGLWISTAAIVVEVVSPDDETWEKFDFYARHAVEEICVADPLTRQVRWFVLAGGAAPTRRSAPAPCSASAPPTWSPASTGPAEPVPRSRYAEAFWWVLPVPFGLVAGVVALVGHPSIVGGAGLVALAGVGLVLEAVVWRHLRRRWAGGTASHPMDIPEPLRQPIEVGMLLAVIVGALTWKAVGLGYSWVSGFLTGLGLLAFYLALWLVDRSVNR